MSTFQSAAPRGGAGARREVLAWAEAGRLAAADLPAALRLAGVMPDGAAWRHFLDRTLLGLGVLLVAAGVIFFFAANWHGMHRFVRFALVEGALAATLGAVAWLGLAQPAGRAALAAACVLVGVLLALIGQTYQTGADTFELFALWTGLILPWALLGRSPVIWVLWIVLANLAIVLYHQTFHGLFGVVLGPRRLLWVLAMANLLALAAWEGVQARGASAGGRWGPRLLATAVAGLATLLAIHAVVDWRDAVDGVAVAAWLAALAAGYLVYRRRHRDAYVLGLGVLSVAVVAAALVGRLLFEAGLDAMAFLLAGLAVTGISAVGGAWLRGVLGETGR